MTNKRLWRMGGIALIAAVALIFGVKTTKAEDLPSMQLTNSSNNWTMQTGSQISVTAQVAPYNYHTISRIEIRKSDVILTTCWNQNICNYSFSVPNGTSYIQAVGYDLDGRIIFSPIMTLTGTNSYNNNSYGAPSVSLWASTYDVDPVANSGMTVESRATSNNQIRELKIYRVEDWRLEVTNTCINEQYSCYTRFYPSFSNADAGKTYTYEARSTDIYGNVGYSGRITVRVRGNIGQGNGGNQMPGVYLDRNTIPEHVNANSAVNIRAESWDNEGVSRLSIYVTRQSYIGDGFNSNDSYQFPWKKNCYTILHNLTCTLDINNFSGYQGQTLYVWAETVDMAGQRAVSNIYSMTVDGAYNGGNNNGTNQVPGIYLDPNTIPAEVKLDSHVAIRADAWDNERLDRVEIYAQPRNYYGYGYNDYNGSVPRYTKTCYSTGTNMNCTLDIANFQGYDFAGRTFDVWARVIDAAGQTTYSKYYTMKVQGNVVNPPVYNQKPGVYVNAPNEVRSDAKLVVRADAWDNEGLSRIIVSAHPMKHSVQTAKGATITKNCAVSGYNASCTLEISDVQASVNKSFLVWAEVYDSNGQYVRSVEKTVTITGGNVPTPSVVPTVTVSPSASKIQENKTMSVSAQASSPNGIWGVEVRALPSWSNEAITKRCISTTTCNMNIGPFPGHAGQTVKVWAIAWDKQTGMGGSSDAKYITVKAAPKPNVAPTVSISPSAKNINGKQTVTFRANASDDSGVQRIEIMVNARLVKTCTGVTTCEYTGGPYPRYAGTTVSYGANAYDSAGKRAWTGYNSISVNREVSRRTTPLRVASTR